MKVSKKDMQLYLVTDRSWLKARNLADQVEEAIKGGVSFVQIREKELAHDNFKKLALEIKEVTDYYKIPFVVNDNIEIAKEIDADGVHLGQDDMGLKEARNFLGKDKIIGISVGNIDQALEAQEEGADYLGLGSLFPTDTKEDALLMNIEIVRQIADQTTIPLVGIGGINKGNIEDLKESGLNGIAVVSAILKEDNVEEAASELLALVKECLK